MNKKHTENSLILELKNLYDSGKDISSKNLRDSGFGSLELAGKRYFGSYNAFLKAAGINPEKVAIRVKDRSPEDLLHDLKDLQSQGTHMSSTNIRRINPALLAASIKHFGTWLKALEAINQ